MGDYTSNLYIDKPLLISHLRPFLHLLLSRQPDISNV